MKKIEAFNMAVDLMSEHGLINMGWTFGFDNAYKRFGVTKFGRKQITISSSLTSANGADIVKNVILHEIAHVIAGPHCGHGTVWRNIALEIGCDGERLAKNIEPPKAKWTSRCPNGHTAQKYRRSRNVSCGRCSSTYNPNYKLTYYANT